MPTHTNTAASSKEIPFTVGKIEEGVAILITEDLQMVEFPSSCLPLSDGPMEVGTVLSLKITKGQDIEDEGRKEFASLQDKILEEYGKKPDETIIGGCLREEAKRFGTVMGSWTSWKAMAEAGGWKATLNSLNCEVDGTIVFTGIGEEETSVRLTGLEPEQTFLIRLIFRTSAGTFASNTLRCTTPSTQDFASLHLAIHPDLHDYAEILALAKELGVYLEDDGPFTHVVSAEGKIWDESKKASIAGVPAVSSEWLLACKEAGKILPVIQQYAVNQQ